jgi:holliday junction DNA helicase RuvA
MIAFLRGTVHSIGQDFVILEVNGVGYKVNFNKVDQVSLNTQLFLYTFQVIKEDSHALYGFLTQEELAFFEQVISVKGIGPRLGLNLLTASSFNRLQKAIFDQDVTYLKSLPGIGAKTAAQIVVDVKGKLVDTDPALEKSGPINDTIEAMKALGYKVTELNGLAQSLKPYEQSDEATRLKHALAWITAKKGGF